MVIMIVSNFYLCFFLAVLADANFPSASVSKEGPQLVRADGMSLLKYLMNRVCVQHGTQCVHTCISFFNVGLIQ